MEDIYEAHFTTFLRVRKVAGLNIDEELIARTKEICPEAILREDEHDFIYDGYCYVSLDEIRAWFKRTALHFRRTYFHLAYSVEYAFILENSGKRLYGYETRDGVMLYDDDVTLIPWEQINITTKEMN